MTRREEIRVPDIGDFHDVEIVEVLVAAGDTVSAEAPLISLETDKASMEVPAPMAGRIVELKVAKGGRVSKGSLIALIEVDEAAAPPPAAPAPAKSAPAAAAATPARPAAAAPAPAAAPAARPPPVRASATLPPIDESGFGKAHASPSVRKLARELGVNLIAVKGSGAKGRVLQEDVKAYVKAILGGQAGGGLPKLPVVDYAKYGEIELVPLSRVRRISGPRLQASWLNIPHVTQHDEADITALEARREALKAEAAKAGVRLTPLAFIIRACVLALREFPDFNSSLSEDGGALVHKKYHHIGFAADTPQGLVVPVIRDAGTKDLFAIARELGDLSARAREGKVSGEEMRGGSFTVSSLGGIGGSFFTPIINAPEVAILGIGRSARRPVWQDGGFVPRLVLPLSLSYDHRVIDGASGVRFTSFLVQALADPDRLAG
ncbi:pyruvate dehydrogenase E2 component (dihydrolipoamide acetyltransferase) [Gammaproteobacteria bacterium]|nr:pyruvate dehydrogenase E2 component (dihydrolipoamide acetyltransferase) [Gammaproteobacteria bacterium]